MEGETSFGYSESRGREMSVRYVVDEQGRPREVILAIGDYEELLERAEDAEALALLRRLKSEPQEYVKLEEALAGLDLGV